MDDIISRQAAIDEVNRLAKFFWEKWHEYAPSTIAVTDALKEIPSAQQWIPCSERLPEDDVEVFVYLFERSTPYIAWIEDCRWYTEDFEVEKENYPTEWMPLPKPYKGEES